MHDPSDNLTEQAEIEAEMAASLALMQALQPARAELSPTSSREVDQLPRRRPTEVTEQRLNRIRQQLDQRQQELDARQRELDRREAALDQREIEANLAEWPPPALDGPATNDV